MVKRFFLVLTGVVALAILLLQFKNLGYPGETELAKRINYLSRTISESNTPDSDLGKLGEENYEWALFTHAYTVYALTNICTKDSNYRAVALPLIKQTIERAITPMMASRFNTDLDKLRADSVLTTSVIYAGHVNLMLGCFRLLSNDTTFDQMNDQISYVLDNSYKKSRYFNLESYPSAIWIPDNSVAIASLFIHNFNTQSEYGTTAEQWLKIIKQKYTHSPTGVLYSTIDPLSGQPLEEPRGSMLGWSIMFIYQMDETFASELYWNYKKHFATDFLAVAGFRERHDVYQNDIGDIDSGPLVFGYSIPACEFALSNAILARDFNTADKLLRLIHTGAVKYMTADEIRYKIRFFDINISPMAEALVLHSLTITKWTN